MEFLEVLKAIVLWDASFCVELSLPHMRVFNGAYGKYEYI